MVYFVHFEQVYTERFSLKMSYYFDLSNVKFKLFLYEPGLLAHSTRGCVNYCA